MYLGKTTMALGVSAHYKDEWPVLDIAPTVLLEQWAEKITRWLPSSSSAASYPGDGSFRSPCGGAVG